MSTALLTDHYELTMVAASLRDGTAGVPAVFEVFARALPAGRRYGVFAGLGRVLDAIESFRFGDQELGFLRERGFLDEATLDYLTSYRFSGDVVAYREGETYFAWSPVMTVESTFAEAVVLETIVLSIVNHDSAVASAAARIVDAAAGRPLIEMGGRRTHEAAAVAAARAAYVAGFTSTSNLEAGRQWGIPTAGTVAHAFILTHESERSAFDAQLATLGDDTTLLVDTFGVPAAIRHAVEAARARGANGPGAVRLDSGDLHQEAVHARRLLDELGATDTRIVASGDLDEHSIAALVAAGAPIDAFGVGTGVVTGSGHPTAGFVYKLVAAGGRSVAKRSPGKATRGGRKRAWRVVDERGSARREVVAGDAAGFGPWEEDVTFGRPLQVLAMSKGEQRHDPSVERIREHCAKARSELPSTARDTVPGAPALRVTSPGGEDLR